MRQQSLIEENAEIFQVLHICRRGETMIDRLKGMIDRLQHELPDMEHLPEPAQEELAAQIEALLGQFGYRKRSQQGASSKARKRTKKEWENPVGAWADMPDTVDEMFEAFEKIRHANPPSPPVELP
jgi:hypothetical protein